MAAGEPIDLHVRVPGDDEVRRRACEHRRELVVGRQPRDEIVVEARRRVTERRAAGDVELDRERPLGDRGKALGPELVRAPGAAVRLAVLEDVAIGISTHEPHPEP